MKRLAPRLYRKRHLVLATIWEHAKSKIKAGDGSNKGVALTAQEIAERTKLDMEEVNAHLDALREDGFVNIIADIEDVRRPLTAIVMAKGSAALFNRTILREGRDERSKTFMMIFGYISVPLSLIATGLGIWQAARPSDHESRIRSLERGRPPATQSAPLPISDRRDTSPSPMPIVAADTIGTAQAAADSSCPSSALP